VLAPVNIMIVSHSKKLVILAPWKTASQTIRERLGHYDESNYGAFFEFNHALKRVVHQHLTYADYLALPEARLGYRTAAFVRNPYDRAYSGFRQLWKDATSQSSAEASPHFKPEWVRSLVMHQIADNFAQLCEAGFDFDRWIQSVEPWQVFEAGRNTSFPLHPNHYWTHYDGRLAVDFVGKVETFEHDFSRLCSEFQLESRGLSNANVDAGPDEFRGDQYGYRYVQRIGPMARARIADLFADDLDLFGYHRVD
jgi:hypothetical protein